MATIDLLLHEVMTSWLGWVLVFVAHSTLWAGGAWLLGRRPGALAPRARNLVWRVALLGPLVTASVQVAAGPAWVLHEVTVAEADWPPEPAPSIEIQPVVHPAPAPVVASPADPVPPAAPLPWTSLLLGVAGAVALARLALVGLRFFRLRRSLAGRLLVSGRVPALLRRLRPEGPLYRVSVAPGLGSPIALGADEICLPPRALAELDEAGLRAVLAHEMAHLERGDNRWLIVSAVLEAALFFQPLYRMARRQLQETAELASDERAVELTGDSLGLARSLATVAEWGLGGADALASGVISRATPLVERVRRLVEPRPPGRGRWAGALASAVLAAVAVLSPGLTLRTADARPWPAAGPVMAGAPVTAVVAPRISGVPSVSPVPARPRVPRPRLALAPADTGQARGLWLIELDATATDAPVRLELRYGDGDHRSHVQSRVLPAQLLGLSRATIQSDSAEARFKLRREAGTFDCQGSFQRGQGAGHFQFQPDPAFAAALRQRGYEAPTADQQLALAIEDVGLPLFDELKAQGYPRPTIEQVVRLSQHGVRLDYVQGLRSLGYQPGSVEALAKMRDHGVTVEYLRGLVAAGHPHLTPEEATRARDHGVTPDFAREMQALHHGQLAMNDLVRLRDHGVSGEYARALATAGYGELPVEDLQKARDHGVSPDFLKAWRELGFPANTLRDLVKVRDHGVTPDYVKELRALGYQKLSPEELIRLRDHGVDAALIRKVQARGIRQPTVDELIKLR